MTPPTDPSVVPSGAPGATDAERGAWLADKIVALGDYAKEAAEMLRRWPSGVTPCAPEPPLPYWEPCNPGCDPEFNGQRSRYCAKLCQNARDALATTDGMPPTGENHA